MKNKIDEVSSFHLIILLKGLLKCQFHLFLENQKRSKSFKQFNFVYPRWEAVYQTKYNIYFWNKYMCLVS